MSFNEAELHRHCVHILNQRRIKNKIVILCEGGIPQDKGRPSPQSYSRMEQMPDANFYKGCVPKCWKQSLPEFVICGDKRDVLDTYSTLLQWHEQGKDMGYLKSEKLFAIVDLDLQKQRIDDYDFLDTDEIFLDLYDEIRVNVKTVSQHRIWVTGLIYKEAYFMIPELQAVFDHWENALTYDERPLQLEGVYLRMCNDIVDDISIQNSLPIVRDRIRYCTGLDCSNTTQLKDSWQQQFKNSQLPSYEKEKLVFALLRIKQVKNYWHQIKPPSYWTGSIVEFRDQLSLHIADFYSRNYEDAKYHISFLLHNLYVRLSESTRS